MPVKASKAVSNTGADTRVPLSLHVGDQELQLEAAGGSLRLRVALLSIPVMASVTISHGTRFGWLVPEAAASHDSALRKVSA
jgi:hypothetical protein